MIIGSSGSGVLAVASTRRPGVFCLYASDSSEPESEHAARDPWSSEYRSNIRVDCGDDYIPANQSWLTPIHQHFQYIGKLQGNLACPSCDPGLASLGVHNDGKRFPAAPCINSHRCATFIPSHMRILTPLQAQDAQRSQEPSECMQLNHLAATNNPSDGVRARLKLAPPTRGAARTHAATQRQPTCCH